MCADINLITNVMKLQNSNRVYKVKETDHEKFPFGPYIVFQEQGDRYINGHFEPVLEMLHSYEKLINWMSHPSGNDFIPHIDTMIALKGDQIKEIDKINHDDLELTKYRFIANIDPIMSKARKKEKQLVKGEVKWTLERTILLIVIIALVIIFLCFSYVMFYD